MSHLEAHDNHLSLTGERITTGSDFFTSQRQTVLRNPLPARFHLSAFSKSCGEGAFRLGWARPHNGVFVDELASSEKILQVTEVGDHAQLLESLGTP